MLAPWIGGAGSAGVAPTTDAGVRSLLAFWIGGAGTSGVDPTPEEPPAGAGDGGSARRYLQSRGRVARRKTRQDEDRSAAMPLAPLTRPADPAQTAQALADFAARQMRRAGLDKRPASVQMPPAAADDIGANSLLLAAMLALLEDED